jgi:hypothetical protein
MAFQGNFTCDVFKTGLLDGASSFSSGTFKIALYTNSATLNASTTEYTATGEVVAAGYTAGGVILTPTVSSSGGVSFVSFTDATWSGAFTARGALIYKVGGLAICVLDFGADRTSATQFQVQFPPSTADSAILRIS